MKKQLISIMVCILVFVISVPVTGAIGGIKAANITIDEECDSIYEVYIDPNIRLTRKHLPLLKIGNVMIDDLQIKEFTQKVIEVIESEGIANSGDIEEIMNDLDLDTKIKGIYFRCRLYSGGGGSADAYGILPFVISMLPSTFSFDSYLGQALFVDWSSSRAFTYINGEERHHKDHQKGYIFGFFGHVYCGGIWPVVYTVRGICTLVIVTEQD